MAKRAYNVTKEATKDRINELVALAERWENVRAERQKLAQEEEKLREEQDRLLSTAGRTPGGGTSAMAPDETLG